jgi:hypothetical protein
MLNTNIKQLKKLKIKKENLTKKLKEINEQEGYLEGLVINELRQEGLTKVTAAGITVSIKNEVYPKIENWDTVLSYIIKEKQYALLSKRVNNSLWREMLEGGLSVEGISTFEKQSLIFRRVK